MSPSWARLMDTSASLPSVAHHMKETDYDSLGFLQQWLTTGSGCIAAAAAASAAASAAVACVLIFFHCHAVIVHFSLGNVELSQLGRGTTDISGHWKLCTGKLPRGENHPVQGNMQPLRNPSPRGFLLISSLPSKWMSSQPADVWTGDRTDPRFWSLT